MTKEKDQWDTYKDSYVNMMHSKPNPEPLPEKSNNEPGPVTKKIISVMATIGTILVFVLFCAIILALGAAALMAVFS